MPQCTEWRGLYKESWTGVIVPDSFAHPAKFSRAFIRKIYDHVIEEGWAVKDDRVIDPFGGVALGGLDAMRHGLHFIGIELEEKFVALGNQNIALWNERYSRMPNWGTAQLLQGDSRKLVDVVTSAVDISVASPPYAGGCAHTGGDDPKPEHIKGGDYHSVGLHLGVSSPPYVLARQGTTRVPPRLAHIYGESEQERIAELGNHRYGETEGQLGAMREGSLDATLAVTSPPYNPPMSQDHNGSRGGQRGTTPSEKGAFVKYGNTEGQLEGMNMEGFECAVSSPPYEAQDVNLYATKNQGKRFDKLTDEEKTARRDGSMGWYGTRNLAHSTEGQISNLKGETFWSASRIILENLYQVLTPGAHAVFVVKSFVRNRQIVDFPSQWAQLCEAVGFKLLHDHHALLTEHYGTQQTMHGEDKELTVARKSFFRRLAESKGSPRIDYENVLCFEKP